MTLPTAGMRARGVLPVVPVVPACSASQPPPFSSSTPIEPSSWGSAAAEQQTAGCPIRLLCVS